MPRRGRCGECCAMISAEQACDQFRLSLDNSPEAEAPFRHWLLQHVLPEEVCAAIDALPLAPPPIDDTKGRRETHNSTRAFFSAAAGERLEGCRVVGQAR